MNDPRFEKSVILMVSHDPSHAMGIVINKALAKVELGDLLEQLAIDPREGAGGEPVFYGGPVQTDRGVVIHTLDYQSPQTLAIGGGMGVTASKEILANIGGRTRTQEPPKRYKLAIGHAGWGAGQLESEIAVNAWCHCDSDVDLVFGATSSDIWRDTFKRLGVTNAMFSKEWSTARTSDAPVN